ncbi:SPOR domain-containing protein [Nitrospinota bacterium]
MAAKDVNLLDDDDGDDAPLDDYGDNLDEGLGGGSGSSSEKQGGGLIRTIVIALGAIVILGGAGWAGYQYWWIPRQIEKQKIIEAQKRLEELKKKRGEQAKEERARRKKELALLQKMQAEAEEKVKETASEKPEEPSGGAQKPDPSAEQPRPTKASARGAAPSKPTAKTPRDAPPKAPPMGVKERAAEKRMATKPPEPQKPRRIAKTSLPPRPKDRAPILLPAREKAIKPKAAPKKSASLRPRKKAPSRYYSVQVATCRTENCVKSFLRQLRAKGYKPYVSGRTAPSSLSTLTEVLLGDFPAKPGALSLASRARSKKIRVSVYKSGERWHVSAGSYSDLEDAAQRLDQVEDTGLRAKLSPRTVVRKKSGFRTVRIGKLSSRREAVAMRARISRSGFPSAYVVRPK